MQYSLGENETTVPEDSWDKDIPAATNAGIYYVWYRVVGDENHLDSEPACIQVIIREREDSGETDPEDNASDETDPDGTDPESKDPDETKPNATDPEDKVPEKTDPDETDPEDKIPEETDPDETDPESNNLDETKPDETDPEYKDPESNPQEDTAPKEEDKIELFVTRCYRVILGRSPDEGGLNDWSNLLYNGRATAAEIVYGFVDSDEFKSRGYSNGDAVEILYNAMLDRGSDADGKAGWVRLLEGGKTLKDVVNGFCVSVEFRGLCGQYGITPGSVK